MDLGDETDGTQDQIETAAIKDVVESLFSRVRQKMLDMEWRDDLVNLEVMLNDYLEYNIQYARPTSSPHLPSPRRVQAQRPGKSGVGDRRRSHSAIAPPKIFSYTRPDPEVDAPQRAMGRVP